MTPRPPWPAAGTCTKAAGLPDHPEGRPPWAVLSVPYTGISTPWPFGMKMTEMLRPRITEPVPNS